MILNRQQSVRIPLRSIEIFLRRLRGELKLGKAGVTVCFVSDPEIARMNRDFRGKKGATDVLSFPAKARKKPRGLRRKSSNDFTDGYAGDIAISAATARRNAARLGRPLAVELRILILHGALHLLGYDHETDHGEMNRAEERLRRRLGLE